MWLTFRFWNLVPRNYDPALHPMEMPREYTRAMNAVKLERVFAKPFIGCLDGHRDGVNCFAKHPKRLSWLYSGACDGEVKVSQLPSFANTAIQRFLDETLGCGAQEADHLSPGSRRIHQGNSLQPPVLHFIYSRGWQAHQAVENRWSRRQWPQSTFQHNRHQDHAHWNHPSPFTTLSGHLWWGLQSLGALSSPANQDVPVGCWQFTECSFQSSRRECLR